MLDYGSGDWRDRYDDRVDCRHCRHLFWRTEPVKLPPIDESADPRTAHRVTKEKRPGCRKGWFPLPGRLRRCPDFEEAQ